MLSWNLFQNALLLGLSVAIPGIIIDELCQKVQAGMVGYLVSVTLACGFLVIVVGPFLDNETLFMNYTGAITALYLQMLYRGYRKFN